MCAVDWTVGVITVGPAVGRRGRRTSWRRRATAVGAARRRGNRNGSGIGRGHSRWACSWPGAGSLLARRGLGAGRFIRPCGRRDLRRYQERSECHSDRARPQKSKPRSPAPFPIAICRPICARRFQPGERHVSISAPVQRTGRSPDYASMADRGVGTILELSLTQLTFTGEGGSDPSLALVMSARARLIRIADKRELWNVAEVNINRGRCILFYGAWPIPVSCEGRSTRIGDVSALDRGSALRRSPSANYEEMHAGTPTGSEFPAGQINLRSDAAKLQRGNHSSANGTSSAQLRLPSRPSLLNRENRTGPVAGRHLSAQRG